MKIPNHKLDEWETVPAMTRFSRNAKGGTKKPDEGQQALEAQRHQQPATA